MDRLKRLVSFRKRDHSNDSKGSTGSDRMFPAKVQFRLDDFDSPGSNQDAKKTGSIDSPHHHEVFRQLASRRPRTNLARTRSRSVECMKQPETRAILRKSILKVPKEGDEDSSVASLEFRSSTPPCRSTRSQSYYAFRPKNLDSPAHSTGNLRASFKANPRFRETAASMKLNRCGSTPPRARGSLTSIRGSGQMDVQSVAENLKAPAINPRLQSEENLLLDLHRKQEANWLNKSKIREESTVLTNIKKREMIEMKKKEPLSLPKIKEEKGGSPSILDMDSSGPKNIAAGLFSTRAILMAPTAAILLKPTSAAPPNPAPAVSEREKLKEWVPPPQEKPRERNIVRKVVGAKMLMPKEPSGTDFLGSSFNKECLQWHNHYRQHHSAPPLQLDANLCASAQYWANILAQSDEYYHQNPPNIGENLLAWPLPVLPETALFMCQDFRGKDVASCWYKTQRNYYFKKKPEVLHLYGCQFSQMVWISSKYFGCGKARSRSGKILIVGHYFPKGNVPGQYHLNVKPSADSFGVERKASMGAAGTPSSSDNRSSCTLCMGQFSQMVWISSKYFGCGKARSRSGKILIVGHYFPKDNVPGQYHLNVKPLADSFGVEGKASMGAAGTPSSSDNRSVSSYSMAAL